MAEWCAIQPEAREADFKRSVKRWLEFITTICVERFVPLQHQATLPLTRLCPPQLHLFGKFGREIYVCLTKEESNAVPQAIRWADTVFALEIVYPRMPVFHSVIWADAIAPQCAARLHRRSCSGDQGLVSNHIPFERWQENPCLAEQGSCVFVRYQ